MNNALGLLGIARRAGKLALGDEQCSIAVRDRKARALFTEQDAAERAKSWAKSTGVPYLPLPITKAELGALTGRASVAQVAVLDVGIAASVAQKLAAVDAQAYAQYAQNKTLYITALNSGEFDVDRACDTLLRIPGQETVFSEFCGVADEGLYTDLLITIAEFIKAVNEKGKFTFKKNPQIKIDVEESEFCAEVTATVHGDVKNVVCYYAYNAPIPKVRAWLKKESYEKFENEKSGNIFKFKLPVYGNVNLMHAYVETEYEDGVKLSSKILCVNTDVKSPVPCPAVLYGGGGLNAEFIECVEAAYKPDEKAEKYIGFDGPKYREAFIDKGVFETTDTPLNIKGVKISGCSAKTYAVRRLTKKPSDSSVIKFDVYLEAAAELKITLETVSGDYDYTINLLSGKAWQNLNIPAGEFKNDKLMGYEGEDILSLKFTVKGAAVINNVLIL